MPQDHCRGFGLNPLRGICCLSSLSPSFPVIIKSKKLHLLTSQFKARSDTTTVQESCTLFDTQSQQLMYKRRQVQLPAVFSQEKHTHFSQNIMASTLINQYLQYQQAFKFMYHYIIDLFSVLFLFLYHTTLQMGELLCGKRTPSLVTSLVGVRSSIPDSFSHSQPLSSLSHNVTVRLNMPVSHIPK